MRAVSLGKGFRRAAYLGVVEVLLLADVPEVAFFAKLEANNKPFLRVIKGLAGERRVHVPGGVG